MYGAALYWHTPVGEFEAWLYTSAKKLQVFFLSISLCKFKKINTFSVKTVFSGFMPSATSPVQCRLTDDFCINTGTYPGDLLQIYRDTRACTPLLGTRPRCRGRGTSKQDNQLGASTFPSEVEETGGTPKTTIVETLMNGAYQMPAVWIISLQTTLDTHLVNTLL